RREKGVDPPAPFGGACPRSRLSYHRHRHRTLSRTSSAALSGGGVGRASVDVPPRWPLAWTRPAWLQWDDPLQVPGDRELDPGQVDVGVYEGLGRPVVEGDPGSSKDLEVLRQ